MKKKKEIKRRIKSVKNIAQVTKALQMVSAVKMRRAQTALQDSMPYHDHMEDLFQKLINDIDTFDLTEFLKTEPQNSIALVMISPSKGFAGPLISNLSRKAIEFIESGGQNNYKQEFIIENEKEEDANDITKDQAEIKLVTVDKKSKDFAIHLKNDILADFPKLSNPPIYEDIVPLATVLLESFWSGEIKEVYVVYTHFLNSFSQKALLKKIFPLDRKEFKSDNNTKPWYSYSEEKLDLFNNLYPAYIESQIFQFVLDAYLAEQASRMVAMQNATDNAKDIQVQLSFEYNQQRQAEITEEIAQLASVIDIT